MKNNYKKNNFMARGILQLLFFLCFISVTRAESISLEVTHISGGQAGMIEVDLGDEGISPFQIACTGPNGYYTEWSNINTSSFTIDNLYEVGQYCIVVTDDNFCTAGDCVNLYDHTDPSLTVTADFDFDIDATGCSVEFYDWSEGDNDIVSWSWFFGDGGISIDQHPTHTFNNGGCFPVTLTATDSNGDSDSYTDQVCIPGCGGGGFLECAVQGPSNAAPGQTISLSALVTGGVPPYDYYWDTDFGVDPVDPTGIGPHNFELPSSASNGDYYDFIVTIVDATGDYTSCNLSIEIGGVIPEVEVSALGTNQENGYMYFVAFIEWWELVGETTYTFNFTQKSDCDGTITGTSVGTSGPQIGDYDYELTFAECGIYTVCVNVQDQVGTYSDCVDFDIDDPVTPTPPTQPWILESFGSSGFVPGVTNIETCQGRLFRINDGQNDVSDYDDWWVHWAVRENGSGDSFENLGVSLIGEMQTQTPDDPGYFITAGNLEVGACYDIEVTVCDEEVVGSSTTCITPSTFNCWATIIPSEIEIGALTLNGECENQYLSIAATCGVQSPNDIPIGPCATTSQEYDSYEWTAYRADDPDVSINNFFEFNGYKCVGINFEHEYFEEFGSGEVFFYAQAIITDTNGSVAQKKELITLNAPLRIVMEDVGYRCEGVSSPLAAPGYVTGGVTPYTYSWTGPNNFTSNEESPLISPTPQHLDTYSVTVTDAQGCSQTHDISIRNSLLYFDLNSHDNLGPNLWYCGTGSYLDLAPTIPIDQIPGSGNYLWQWEAFYDYDQTQPYPLTGNVNSPTLTVQPTSEQIYYLLTLTDLFGGCSYTNRVNVWGIGDIEPYANAGDDLENCNASVLELGDPLNGTGTDVPLISWTTDYPGFPGSDEAKLTIDGEGVKPAGTFNFQVRVEDEDFGCYNEDEVNVTIGKPWLYEGYESDLVFVFPGNTLYSAWSDSDNNNIDVNDNYLYASNIDPTDPLYNQNSGAEAPFQISWSPSAPNFTNNTSLGVPYQAQLNIANEEPFYTMVVEDNKGCSQSFMTNRFIQFKPESPTGSLTIIPADPSECETEVACVEMLVEVPYLGGVPLPNSMIIELDVNHNASGNDHMVIVALSLTDPIGIYQGTHCISVEDINTIAGHYDVSFRVLDDENPWLPFNGGTLDQDGFNYSNENPVSEVICFGGTASQGQEFKAFYTFSPNADDGFNCSGGQSSASVNNGTSEVELVGGPQGFVKMKPGFHAEQGSDAWAYINPCFELRKSVVTDDPNGNTKPNTNKPVNTSPIAEAQLGTFKVFPNPFREQINIEFEIYEPAEIVTLRILDITGKEINTIIKQSNYQSGYYNFTYDSNNLPAGTYFFELKINQERKVKKVIKILQ